MIISSCVYKANKRSRYSGFMCFFNAVVQPKCSICPSTSIAAPYVCAVTKLLTLLSRGSNLLFET